jgi:Uma2 family endonuclease
MMCELRVPTLPFELQADGQRVKIPGGITDLASFRRWARSHRFPEVGRIDYLDGTLWVDLGMEEFFYHNAVKTIITAVLHNLSEELDNGRFVSDRMRVSFPGAKGSVEPDGMFVLYETFRTQRIRQVRRKSGVIEFEGTPDMVLEVISPTSEYKDKKVLPKRYARAGILEFWRVDVREDVRFEIFRLAGLSFRSGKADGDGWLRSPLFDRSFRVVRTSDPLGQPKFRLEVRR